MSFVESIKELKDIDFADLDIQQIGIWPAPVKTLLLVAVAIVILILGYFLKGSGFAPAVSGGGQ